MEGLHQFAYLKLVDWAEDLCWPMVEKENNSRKHKELEFLCGLGWSLAVC